MKVSPLKIGILFLTTSMSANAQELEQLIQDNEVIAASVFQLPSEDPASVQYNVEGFSIGAGDGYFSWQTPFPAFLAPIPTGFSAQFKVGEKFSIDVGLGARVYNQTSEEKFQAASLETGVKFFYEVVDHVAIGLSLSQSVYLGSMLSMKDDPEEKAHFEEFKSAVVNGKAIGLVLRLRPLQENGVYFDVYSKLLNSKNENGLRIGFTF